MIFSEISFSPYPIHTRYTIPYTVHTLKLKFVSDKWSWNSVYNEFKVI